MLLERTNASVLVNAILPRGTQPSHKQSHTHSAAASDKLVLDDRISWINAHLREHTSSVWRPQYPGRAVAMADCGRVLLTAPHTLNRSLMPDGLHPNAAGYTLLLRCWERQIGGLVLTPV